MECPSDNTLMRVHAKGDLDVESCEVCGGAWIHHNNKVAFKALRELIGGTAGLMDSLRDRVAGPGDPGSEASCCPGCEGALIERQIRSGAAAAVCITCGGAWISADELAHLLWDGPQIDFQKSVSASHPTAAELDRFSFNHRLVFLLALPLASVAGIVVNSSFLIGLVRPFHIWIHEFGHATIAWLSGRRALPLPLGWTSWQPERSTVVYVALLFLLGVLFYTAWKERLRGAMAFAGITILVQFVMTWTLSQYRIEQWISFGGIGGEFYLSAMLMILFYFPMPDCLRWDFWRYPVLLIAASTFWENFSFWNGVERGRESIPWGSILGDGDGGGDMDRLSFQYGWPNDQIIGTYNSLGDFC